MLRTRSIHLPGGRSIALGVALVALGMLAVVALVAVQPVDRSQRDSGATSPKRTMSSESATSAPEAATSAGRSFAGADASVSTESSAVVPDVALDAPALDPKIVRNGSLRLSSKRASFEQVFDDVQSTATRYGGYVIAANRNGAGREALDGSIMMRVATDRFEAALDHLRDVDGARVKGLDVSSQDVTQEYVDTKSRLRHDRAVEARLMTLLAATKGVSEVLAVQSRLDVVQEQIEVSRGRLQYLDKVTAMSTIQVDLHAPAAKGRAGADEPAGPIASAFSDAGERFVDAVADGIVWFGGALPTLLLLGTAGVIGWVIVRRKRQKYASEQGVSE